MNGRSGFERIVGAEWHKLKSTRWRAGYYLTIFNELIVGAWAELWGVK